MAGEFNDYSLGAEDSYQDSGVGKYLYDVYEKTGEKLDITDKKRRESSLASKQYMNNFYATKEGGKVRNEKYMRDVDNIYRHVLASYRFGDSFLKRTGLQTKELLQAGTHWKDEEVRKDEYGDFINNKVGFYLRNKYGDDEEAAMKELGKMIFNNDERLHFVSEEVQGFSHLEWKKKNEAAKVGKQAGGLIMNYGDYGRNYK